MNRFIYTTLLTCVFLAACSKEYTTIPKNAWICHNQEQIMRVMNHLDNGRVPYASKMFYNKECEVIPEPIDIPLNIIDIVVIDMIAYYKIEKDGSELWGVWLSDDALSEKTRIAKAKASEN